MVDQKTIIVLAVGLFVGVIGGIAANAVGGSSTSNPPTDRSETTALFDVDTEQEWATTNRASFAAPYTIFEGGEMKIREYGTLQGVGPRWESQTAYRTPFMGGPVRLKTLTARGYIPDDPVQKTALELTILECSSDVFASGDITADCQSAYSVGPTSEPGTLTVQENLSHMTIDPVLVVRLKVAANTTSSLPADQEPYWDSFRIVGQRQAASGNG